MNQSLLFILWYRPPPRAMNQSLLFILWFKWSFVHLNMFNMIPWDVGTFYIMHDVILAALCVCCFWEICLNLPAIPNRLCSFKFQISTAFPIQLPIDHPWWLAILHSMLLRQSGVSDELVSVLLLQELMLKNGHMLIVCRLDSFWVAILICYGLELLLCKSMIGL